MLCWNLSEKGSDRSDPLEASRFHWFSFLSGEGQTPFRTGSKVFFNVVLH